MPVSAFKILLYQRSFFFSGLRPNKVNASRPMGCTTALISPIAVTAGSTFSALCAKPLIMSATLPSLSAIRLSPMPPSPPPSPRGLPPLPNRPLGSRITALAVAMLAPPAMSLIAPPLMAGAGKKRPPTSRPRGTTTSPPAPLPSTGTAGIAWPATASTAFSATSLIAPGLTAGAGRNRPPTSRPRGVATWTCAP